MAGKRLIDAKDFRLRVSSRKLVEIFPNWKELPEEVKEMICKHGKHLAMLLETQPTVDAVEVVHGRFESARYGYGCCKIATCSVCGYKNGLYINGRVPDWNYCPNCGAKMDGGADDA